MKKISYLNGLRGVAALQVVFHHFILAFYPALFSGPGIPTHMAGSAEVNASGSVLNLIWDGNFAVCIFFVLSGFVLSHKFFLKKEHEIITASAVKRYFRLALPVAFSVLSAFILMKLSLFFNQPAGDISGSGWLSSFWTFKPDFLDSMKQAFVGTFFSSVFDYNAILWTIACEFLGSFLVFGFLAIFGRAKNRFWAYAFLIIVFFQTYYLAFLLGMMLSDLMAHKQAILGRYDRKKIIRTVFLILGLFLGSFPIGREPQGTMYAFMDFPWLADPAALYHVLGAFLLMIVLLESKKMQKFFSIRYFLFLGEISFAMYLLHFIILGSLSSFLFLKFEPAMAYQYAVLLSFALSLPVILLVSYLAYRFVDKKSVDLSHLLYEKVFNGGKDRMRH
jgi:peptidoglycan/LPS O-acetylase OafA/YrhL